MSLAKILNFDVFSAKWRDLAACKGMGDTPEGLALFFEDYESNAESAKAIDEMCSSCPVAASCLKFGNESKSEGVFGGWFLTNGNPDQRKNAHKDERIIKKLTDNIKANGLQ